jgi:phospholipase C
MQRINHVIVIMLENRSFHHVLGFMEAHENHYSYDGQREKIYCTPIDPQSGGDGICHDIAATLTSIEGINDEPMTGFVFANQYGIHNVDAARGTGFTAYPSSIMGYAKEDSMPVIHTLAKNGCVATRWFSSCPTETFPNRDYVVSGTSRGSVADVPFKLWQFFNTAPTIFDKLSNNGLSWRIYYQDFLDSIVNPKMNKPQIMRKAYKLDQLVTDIEKDELRTYSYVQMDTDEDAIIELVPYIGKNEVTIAKVYNALRKSPRWTDTLLIITYDEHGGFYDSITPPNTYPPDNMKATFTRSNSVKHTETFRFDKLGIRVPTILISPWLAGGFDDKIYDHTSIFSFLEARFRFTPLTERDNHASCSFNFSDCMHDHYPDSVPVPVPRANNHSLTLYYHLFSFVTKVLVGFSKVLP